VLLSVKPDRAGCIGTAGMRCPGEQLPVHNDEKFLGILFLRRRAVAIPFVRIPVGTKVNPSAEPMWGKSSRCRLPYPTKLIAEAVIVCSGCARGVSDRLSFVHELMRPYRLN
jgi:hypothetical protein